MKASGKRTSSAPDAAASAVSAARSSSVASRSRIAGSACTHATVTGLLTMTSLPAPDRLQPLAAGAGPQSLRIVVDLERRHRLREHDPAQLRPREDVDVRRDLRGVVERPPADEQHLRAAVLAVDGHLAGGTSEDAL